MEGLICFQVDMFDLWYCPANHLFQPVNLVTEQGYYLVRVRVQKGFQFPLTGDFAVNRVDIHSI